MPSRLDSGDTDSCARISDTDQPEFHDTNGTQKGPRSKMQPTFWRPVAQRVGLTDLSRHGWRAGVRCAAALSAFVLLLNISVIVVAYTHPVRQQSGESFGPLIIGDCERIKRIGTWIHLGINVLSSLVLGGSNYCLQCLSAPTRTEVDKAHSEGFWLHIGVPNLRNFWKIRRRKFLVWVILGLSSIPFHLLYNSAFYTSTMRYSYDIYFADEGFATGADFDEDLFSTPGSRNVTIRLPNGTISETMNYGGYTTNVHKIRNLAMEGENGPFKRLAKDECIQKYAKPLLTDRRNLILVTSNSPLDNLTFVASSDMNYITDLLCLTRPPQTVVCGPQDSHAIMTQSLDLVSCKNSSLYAIKTWVGDFVPNLDGDYFQWICSQNGTALGSMNYGTCGPSNCTAEAVWEKYHGSQRWIVAGFDIDYCLSEEMPGECALNVGLPFLLTVVTCNLVKLLALIAALRTIKEDPLITIGDAMASFIKRPDESSRGLCLWSWTEVVHRRHLRSHGVGINSYYEESSTAVMELLTTRDDNPIPSRYIPVELAQSFSDLRQRRYTKTIYGHSYW